jgi:translation initiation factor IF-2
MQENHAPEVPARLPDITLRRRTKRLGLTVALALGAPLACLAYKVGGPKLAELFRAAPYRAVVMVSPEGQVNRSPLLAMPVSLPNAAGGLPDDSTRMIAHELPPQTPPAAPPAVAEQKPKPVPAPQNPPQLKPEAPKPVQAPPVAQAPARQQYPHLRAKTFQQQEAERQPTMFVMNVGQLGTTPTAAPTAAPAQSQYFFAAPNHGAPTPAPAAPATPPATTAPAAPAAPPAAEQPKTVPKTPTPLPAPPKKKKPAPIPHDPPPRTDNRFPGQAQPSPTAIFPGEPQRFAPGSPGPASPSNAGEGGPQDLGGASTRVGPPDLPPPPNPQTTGSRTQDAPAKPIPLTPSPRTDNRQPGQNPFQAPPTN